MQEVEEAMAQLKDGKAPGPDSFTSNFFHKFWELISRSLGISGRISLYALAPTFP